MKKSSVSFNSSSQTMNSASGSHNSRHKCSFTDSSPTRRSSISNRKHSTKDSSSSQAPRKTVKVFENVQDIIPLALTHAESGDVQSKPGRVFPICGPDLLISASSSYVPYFSRPCSLSTTASHTRDTMDSVSEPDIPINRPPPCEVLEKRDRNVTEEMLDEVVDFCLSDTETISLLDIPPRLMSDDADDAEAAKERNIKYAELCKNRMGNDKFVVRSMQTLSGEPKNKQIQTEQIVMVDEGSVATTWDIYDSFCEQRKNPESESADYLENTVNPSKHQEDRGEMYSSSSTVCTGSTVTLLNTTMSSSSFNAESDLQTIMLSESFQHSLLVMERNVVANSFQPWLAAYRQLEDADHPVKPASEEQSEDGEERSSPPALEHLWAFSCELTTGCNITSMAWNKKNRDLLAVGYGYWDSTNQEQSLICCWSLKNPTWPERVFRCHSCVTSLDFSANNPNQLAVGMFDGTVAVYDVQRQDVTCTADSSECSKMLLHPVWQVKWTEQEMILSGEGRVEALVSVSADSRITKWLLCSSGLDCIDLMKLKKTNDSQKKAPENKKMKKKMDSFVSTLTPGLCFDFHPTDFSVYLAGTWDGHIHKCSVSNSDHFLATYQKHISPVNHVEWSPFCSDVFLSCSSDWTVQLWKQDLLVPVLSFSSIQRPVVTATWSPNWSTVFAAIIGEQVEIWDLNSSLLHPAIVHHAVPGVKLTSLLFTTGTDCVLVGDSDGQVTVYQLKNLSVPEGKQVDSLEDIIRSAVSRKL
ncbi:dynein axonemal intermediate chain 4-like [Centropristis striata]|uniref:dynein axonemal intermediate chain 4-like n=1 Tax=Centropristis striata TaxID=184440 RepID=UPI0027E0F80F|nr:dynein axonemal intermediate chain 4-like [Centropristis striata]